MKSKVTTGIALTVFLVSMLTLVFDIQPIKASGTIYIRADGSIEGTTYISTVDNITYTFTDNINDLIVVERSNIVVDGAGYMLKGTGSGTGIYLSGRSNVTIKNTEIKAFHTGIRLNESYDNTIYGNNITNNHFGILLRYSSNFNNISGNNVLNSYYGIELDSSNNTIYHNNFINNTEQVHSSESTNTWDDDAGKGNYWSDYEEKYPNATKIDDIWNTPYVIDDNNLDNYPLISPWSPPPVEVPFWMQWWFWTIVITGIAVLAGIVYFLKKKKPPTPTTPPLPVEGTLQNIHRTYMWDLYSS